MKELFAEIDLWQSETDLVSAETYRDYMRDGDTRSLASLEKLERAFERVVNEIDSTEITGTPAVWSLYNMGYLVKTRESFFSIDLIHRRATELVDKLDFALITHNHGDHCDLKVYQALDAQGKTVISNFLDNCGARGDAAKNPVGGGFVMGEKIFKIKDVEISTSLVDHNAYLLDFTTAFEIRAGGWKLYHTGDCGVADKLKTRWGRPDVWTFFPGCGLDVAAAAGMIRAEKLIFGHLWELNHRTGRLTAPLIRSAVQQAQSVNVDPHVAFWGERIV